MISARPQQGSLPTVRWSVYFTYMWLFTIMLSIFFFFFFFFGGGGGGGVRHFQHYTGHITMGSFIWAEETSTHSWSRFCTLNCRPMASNYQLSHLRSGREPNPNLRGGRRVLPLCHRAPYINNYDYTCNFI